MEEISIQLSGNKEEQLAEIVARERAGLFRFIRSKVGLFEDAEDILQDVLLQLTTGFEDIRSLDKVSSWLYQVARNRITDRYRKKKTPSFSEIEGKTNSDPLSLEDILPDLTNVPDKELFKNAIWETVEEALNDMPDAQQHVFVLHEFEGKSFQDIASETGETINTLLSRKRYAIKFLRKRLFSLYQEL